jgi:ComF family protein
MSAGRYEGALRDIIHAFKYEGRRSLADPLGTLMRESGRAIVQDCDCVVPVPLHPWRRLRRGFNQARELAERLDRPVVSALWRIRSTTPQMALDAGARRSNVRDAFMMSPRCTRRSGAGLYGPRLRDGVVLLVDDIRTTGATLDECAIVLRRAGVGEVRAVTLAFA